MQELAGAVTTCGGKHGEVSCDGDGEDLVLVDVLDLDHLALVDIISQESTTISAVVKRPVKSTPLNAVDNMILWSLHLERMSRRSLLFSPFKGILCVEDSDEAFPLIVISFSFIDDCKLLVTKR